MISISSRVRCSLFFLGGILTIPPIFLGVCPGAAGLSTNILGLILTGGNHRRSRSLVYLAGEYMGLDNRKPMAATRAGSGSSSGKAAITASHLDFIPSRNSGWVKM